MTEKRGKRRFLQLLWSLVLTCSLIAGMSMSAWADETGAQRGADQDIVVLYTNDVHCGIDDNIGYGGLSLYKKEMLKQTPYVTLVDAGDAIQGAPVGTLSEGGYIIDIMNQVGYDVAVPGNHEFDYGMSRFLELSGKLNCGYYSCNFISKETGNTVFAPYKLISYGDTKVAYVGVSTPESFTKSTPAYFQDTNGNYIYSFCEDESGEAFYRQVQSSVDSARAEGADFVILVGHLGETGVTERWSSVNLLSHIRGVDVCIDGHSHETTPSMTVKDMDGKDVIITQTGTKLANIGKLTIRKDGTISAELVSEVPASDVNSTYTVQKNDSLSRIAKRELGSYNRWTEIYNMNRDKISNPENIYPGMVLTIRQGSVLNENGRPVDPDTENLMNQIKSQYNETLKTPLGSTPYTLTINDAETGKRRIRSGETNLGDLAADAYRTQLGADIGLSNGGGVRVDIKTGTITYEDTLAVFPFGNMGCVVEATGQQIKDALEMGAQNYPEESGGFMQVSGLTYTIDSSVKSSVKTDDKGNFISVDGPYRVTDIQVGGQPIDLNKTYTVASHNYMLKSGGDGMTMFNGCNVIKDDVMVDVDVLSSYIQSLGGTVTADYADPAGQGRIVIR